MEAPTNAPTITKKLFRMKSTRLDMEFVGGSGGLIAGRTKTARSDSTLAFAEPPPAPTKRPKSFVRSNTEPLVQRDEEESKVKPKKKHKDSPHIRLYALGVHLLDHKDQVHQLYSHYTSDAQRKMDPRRTKSKTQEVGRSSSLANHKKSISYDAVGFRQFAESAGLQQSMAPKNPSSVRSTIKKLRRQLSRSEHETSLVEVSRKNATPIEKHNTVRPGVSPIRSQKSPTRLQVAVVPRRVSIYGTDENDENDEAILCDDTNSRPASKPKKYPSSAKPKSPTASPREKKANGDGAGIAEEEENEVEKAKVQQLMEQINLLKSTLGLTDEDLQWKVESAKSNAFVLADKKLTAAEEEYDRLLYEQSLLASCPFEDCTKELMPLLKQLAAHAKETAETKASLLVLQQEVNSTKKNLMDARVNAEMKRARSNSPPRRESVMSRDCVSYQAALGDQKKELLTIQEKFKQGVLKQDSLQKQVLEATEAMVTKFGAQAVRFSANDMADAARKLMEIVHELGQTLSADGVSALCDKAIDICKLFHGYQSKELSIKEREINATLKQMETWRSRREQSKEYPAEMKKLEIEWKATHASENQACYERLCTLIPETITSMSVEQLLDTAKAAGVLYTRDLANYLKQNKFLQWIITHEKDKCRENFITGDTAQCFTNFEVYDVNEMRGLFLALPETFEFDKDGRKAEWRLAFIAHLKILVQQQRGECVKAGWDPAKGARADVKLKPLSEKQLLNPMYRYPTEEEIKQRLEKFETQAKRLAQKKSRMKVLIDMEIPLAKKEYHAVSEDCRSEELLKQFGKPALIKLRDESKKVYQSLCKECDTLKGEIAVGERAAQVACPTYEQYVEEIAAIRQLPPEVRSAVIKGPFSANPIIKPKERAVHKKLSAEEEALARKHELNHAIAERTKEFSETKKPQAGEVEAVVDSSDVPAPGQPQKRSSTHMQEAVNTVVTLNKTIRAVKASPAVLKFLQNDFCNRPRRRLSGGSPEKPNSPKMGVILDGDEMQDEAPAPPPETSSTPPVPKSNALLKLMGLTTTPVLKKRPSMLHDPNLLEDLSKPNMLAEIQRRRSSKGTPPASPLLKKPGPNFLEELKKRAESKASSTGQETSTSSEAIEAQPKPPPVAIGKPMSFLDELKRKAKPTE